MRCANVLFSLGCLFGLMAAVQAGDKPSSEAQPAGSDQPLPQGAIARLGGNLYWHAGEIGAVAVSPDGKLIATGEKHGAYYPRADGGFASGDPDPQIRTWHTRTGRLLHIVDSGFGWVISLEFSSDGKSLAAGGGFGGVSLFDVGDGGSLRLRWEAIEGRGSVAFSRDGKTLLTQGGSTGVVQLDLRTGRVVRKWKVPEQKETVPGEKEQEIHSLDLSTDGSLILYRTRENVPSKDKPEVISSSTEYAEVFEAGTGKRLYASRRYDSSITTSFSSDGRFLAVGGNPVQVLDARSGKPLHQFPADDRGIPYLLFFAAGDILAVAQKETDRIDCWSTATGKAIASVRIGKAYGLLTEPVPMAFSGSRLWVGERHVLLCWDLARGREWPEQPGHRTPVTDLAFSGDGSKLCSVSGEAVVVWDVPQCREVRRTSIGASDPGSHLLCVSAFQRRGVWESGPKAYELRDLETGKVVASIAGKSTHLLLKNPFLFAGKLLFYRSGDGDEGQGFWRYDGATGKELGRADYEGIDYGTDLAQAISPDGKTLAACSPAGTVTLLALETGRVLHRFPDRLVLSKEDSNASLYRLIFSQDGKYLASVFREESGVLRNEEYQANAIQVWEITTGWEVGRIRVPPKEGQRFAVASLAVSPDHRLVAFGMYGEDSVRLWEIATGTERAQLGGHRGVVTAVAFSPDGKCLASGGSDGSILLWDLGRVLETQGAGVPRPAPKDLAAHWQALAAPDARTAEQGIWGLVQSGAQGVAFLSRQCKSAQALPEKEMTSLIQSLDDDRFAVRERAVRRLQELGDLARPALEKALGVALGLEAKQRIEALLREGLRIDSSPVRLQIWRSLEVLERIGSPAAQEVLERLTKGAPEARLTREALACLERLRGRMTPNR